MIDEEKLRSLIPEINDIYFFDSISSTSTFAKEVVKAGSKTPFLVISKEQTEGRGRQGKSFFSPKDTGLYLTLALPFSDKTQNHIYITTASSVAVFDSILSLTGVKCSIKWVNDLYISGRKISGILTESVKGETSFILIGIGINLTTQSFPDSLKDIASSLNKDVDINLLASDLIRRLLTFWKKPFDLSFMKTYRENSLVLGREVTYIKNNNEYRGFAREILDSGALLIEKEDGFEILDSGEITLKL